MRNILTLWTVLLAVTMALASGQAQGQTLTVYTSSAAYSAALPTTSLSSAIEDFSSVTADADVSTVSPQSWNGFTVLATGTSAYGPSKYCTSLRACLNWTTSPPALPGIFLAVDSYTNGRLSFTPGPRTFAFGLDYWDWNDGAQRSEILVTLSNGTVITVTGPSSFAGDPGGFVGFQLDRSSVNAGISISSVTWVPTANEAEIIAVKNIRTSVANATLATAKTSQVWDPGNTNKKFIPGNEILYRVDITNAGLAPVDTDGIFVVDNLPPQIALWNGDVDAGGPDTYAPVAQVGFSQANGAALTFTPASDFGVSTAATAPTSFGQCTPATLDSTFRADIRFLCFRPRGRLLAGASGPKISFVFRARIN